MWHEERPKDSGLFKITKSKPVELIMTICNSIKSSCKEERSQVFSLSTGNTIRSNRPEQVYRKCSLDIKERQWSIGHTRNLKKQQLLKTDQTNAHQEWEENLRTVCGQELPGNGNTVLFWSERGSDGLSTRPAITVETLIKLGPDLYVHGD